MVLPVIFCVNRQNCAMKYLLGRLKRVQPTGSRVKADRAIA